MNNGKKHAIPHAMKVMRYLRTHNFIEMAKVMFVQYMYLAARSKIGKHLKHVNDAL